MSSSSSPFRSLSMRSFDPFDAVLEKEQHAVNEAYYAADVGSRMRVPKRITLTGAEDDLFSVVAPSGFNRASSFASSEDPALRSMMTVPDRILVAGQDRHVGERGPPRELVLERTIIPPEVETIRVQTPPRVLTLEEHKFPAADDPPVADQKLDSPELASSDSSRGSISTLNGIPPLLSKVEVEMNFTNATPSSALKRSTSTNDLQMLHQQLCRLNRRVMDLEAESHQRQQRDTFLGILAAAYIVLKAVNWMRS